MNKTIRTWGGEIKRKREKNRDQTEISKKKVNRRFRSGNSWLIIKKKVKKVNRLRKSKRARQARKTEEVSETRTLGGTVRSRIQQVETGESL